MPLSQRMVAKARARQQKRRDRIQAAQTRREQEAKEEQERRQRFQKLDLERQMRDRAIERRLIFPKDHADSTGVQLSELPELSSKFQYYAIQDDGKWGIREVTSLAVDEDRWVDLRGDGEGGGEGETTTELVKDVEEIGGVADDDEDLDMPEEHA